MLGSVWELNLGRLGRPQGSEGPRGPQKRPDFGVAQMGKIIAKLSPGRSAGRDLGLGEESVDLVGQE